MNFKKKYDVCVIGSGAGAGPVIYELSKAGFEVLVLEKGPLVKTDEFSKDEFLIARKNAFSPKLKDEYHTTDIFKNNEWREVTPKNGGRNYWNGNLVGGSSNFMSGHFHRMKPNDFNLASAYKKIKNSTIVDWPISYNDLEPYYEKVERIVGISGKVTSHKYKSPRSTQNFPYPPLAENIVSKWLDKAGERLGYDIVPVARAIISQQKNNRKPCYYSAYCGGYPCSSDAKGSSRASLIKEAQKTKKCTVIDNAKAYFLKLNNEDNISEVHFYKNKEKKIIQATIFVVACNAIETSRLLLMSKNKNSPNGVGNKNNQVGKNLISTSGGIGYGKLYFSSLNNHDSQKLKALGLFVNRALMEFYEMTNGEAKKGGMIDFLFEHSSPLSKLSSIKKNKDGSINYGSQLKEDIYNYFTKHRTLNFEVFNDWTPNKDCFVTLSKKYKDKWGDPVAKVRMKMLENDKEIAKYLGEKGKEIMTSIGAKEIKYYISNSPSTNLMAGGCRFGNDSRTSVLDQNCKVHGIKNLYITDGSFMPTGGSITQTWTIYANSFRVADFIIDKLKKEKS